jgi:glycosyltransferase involved in cell wall biosynthesis
MLGDVMELKDVRVALCFKDFAAWLHASCVGLNVAGYATAQVLRDHGVECTVIPVRHNVDLVTGIYTYNNNHDKPLTHVVISAPWLSVYDLKSLLIHFPKTEFAVLSHSNVGFLQADPCGVELIRYYLRLTREFDNFRVGANSERLFQWLQRVMDGDAVLLPNLYPATQAQPEKHWYGTSPLRIGAFGAVRPEKNFMTAAAAAILIQKLTKVNVELHMSAGGEGGGERTMQAIDQLIAGDRKITLIRHDWCLWPDFIKLVRQMDLLLQPSYTESFNMVTADGIIMGVPSVVSPAIDWAPESWKADSDDVNEVAEIGICLLRTGNRGEGKKALADHNKDAWQDWLAYLTDTQPCKREEHDSLSGRFYRRFRDWI